MVIAGSDRRGTIYGIYEISEQIGVSPWHWWADVPPRKRSEVFIRPGTFVQRSPVVRYRGIFINDEDPCFGGWSRAKDGGINSVMYSNVFELLLRLRANYLWPAIWGKAFNEDAPRNPAVADEYGKRDEHVASRAYDARADRMGYPPPPVRRWRMNYRINAAALRQFWADGIQRVRRKRPSPGVLETQPAGRQGRRISNSQ